MKHLRHSLFLKVTSLIAAIPIAGFGILVILNIRQETEDRIQENRETARLLADSMMTSIEKVALSKPGRFMDRGKGNTRPAHSNQQKGGYR